MTDIFRQLAAPFPLEDLAWRVARSGMTNAKPWAQVLVYIDARAARARLNSVVGPENWTVAYTQGPANSVIATLSLRLAGEWISKEDGAEVTDVAPVKGALSGAFKRACAVWGIGEYLYNIGDAWAVFSEDGAQRVRIDGKIVRWDAPKLSPKFLPAGSPVASPTRPEIVRDRQVESEGTGGIERVSPVARQAREAAGPDRRRHVATGAPAPGLATTVLVPFGQMRGRPLEQMLKERPGDVRAGRDWAAKVGRFAEYVAAVDALLAS